VGVLRDERILHGRLAPVEVQVRRIGSTNVRREMVRSRVCVGKEWMEEMNDSEVAIPKNQKRKLSIVATASKVQLKGLPADGSASTG
jgi:hypothetical protein